MKRRLITIAKWIGYPLFYLLCLLLFIYATFPFDMLKNRIIAEFARNQQRRATAANVQPMRLEIGELDGYWFSGIEIKNARLINVNALGYALTR